MKEIQLVALHNSGFQQRSNVKIRESRANADKQKPDAIKGKNNIRENQSSTSRSGTFSFIAKIQGGNYTKTLESREKSKF